MIEKLIKIIFIASILLCVVSGILVIWVGFNEFMQKLLLTEAIVVVVSFLIGYIMECIETQ